MGVYMCKNDGVYSMTDQRSCHICDCKDWKSVDAQLLSPSDWKMMYEFAETPEEEFQIADAWAETGRQEAIRMRAMMPKTGTGCKKDVKRAVEDLSRLADKKDREAIFLLACCHIAGDGVPADPMKGLSMLWHARDMKYPEAAWVLATIYSSGTYVSQNEKKAMRLFKQAAEMGSEMGMYEYGLRLFRSAKDVKERELGLSWLWRSARSDCGEAQAALGFLFGKDSSVQDFNQSLYWLGRAVNNEVAGAAATYASIWYEENGGLFIDEEEYGKIVQMLKGALDRGETSAAGVLGDFCRKGVGQPQDFDKAFKYYRRGQGHDINCIAGVAHCYMYGLGVEKNPSMAHLILSDFIELGEDYCNTSLPEIALLDMGDMYRDGNGVRKNPKIAAMIYDTAAKRKDSVRAKGRWCREFLSGNPNVSGLTEQQAMNILDCVCEEGDFDASFFLTNYYLNAGNMEKASVYMNEALHVESEYLDKPATNLAKEKFPDVLRGFCSDADFQRAVMTRRGHPPISESKPSSESDPC